MKKDYPDSQVRVNIDLKNLALRVARRPAPVEGQPAYWVDHTRLISLPKEVFDISARAIPENFTVKDLPDSPKKASKDSVPMQTDQAVDSSQSRRLSRKDSHEGVKSPAKNP